MTNYFFGYILLFNELKILCIFKVLAKLLTLLCGLPGFGEAPNIRYTIKTFAGRKSSSASVCSDDKDVEYSRGILNSF